MTVAEHNKRDALLLRLYDHGRLDLLRAIKAGTISVTEVYAADREKRLDALTGDRALLGANLWDTVKAWTPTSAVAPATRKRYATSFAALQRAGVLKAHATVNDLAGVDWKSLQVAWQGGSADWNHLRRAVSHFLAMHVGDVFHPIRRAVVSDPEAQRGQSRARHHANALLAHRPRCS